MTDGGIPVEHGLGIPRSKQQEAFKWVQQDIGQMDIRPLGETYYRKAFQGTAQALHDAYRKNYIRQTEKGEGFREYFLDDWREIEVSDAWRREVEKDKDLRADIRMNPHTKKYEINLPQFGYFNLPPSLQEAYKKQAEPALQLVHLAVTSGMKIDDQMLDTLAARLYEQEAATYSSEQQIAFTDPRFSEEERERYRELIVISAQGYVGATHQRYADFGEYQRTAYEQGYHEVKERLKDPWYLPTTQEVRTAFNFRPPFDGPNTTTDFMEFLKEQYKGQIGIAGTSEYPTREYIDGLAAHLYQSVMDLGASPTKKITILEVGANNGRLMHFLQETLAKKYAPWKLEDYITMVAVDKYPIKHPDLPQMFDVKEMDYKEALAHYQPDIVIGSWITSTTFASEDEVIGSVDEDWTEAMRRTDSVREYILIGDPQEHGRPEAFGQDPKTRKSSWLYQRMHTPAFEREGFSMDELSELAQHQFSYRDTDTNHRSRTYSFRKK